VAIMADKTKGDEIMFWVGNEVHSGEEVMEEAEEEDEGMADEEFTGYN
jgi:hypothetical protein